MAKTTASKGSKNKNHTLRIIFVSLGVFVFGLAILAMYWSARPLQQLKAQRLTDTIIQTAKHGNLTGEKLDGSTAQEVPVLLYHGILKNGDDGFSISQENFNQQMVALKKAGYTTITTNDYLAFLNGKKDLPSKSIMVTFDDGRKDSFYRGDPILKALDFKAVMYLTSGYSIVDGSKYYLNRTELLEMNKTDRWDIQAHADYSGTNKIVVDESGRTENFFGYLKWLPVEKRVETLVEYRERVSTEFRNASQKLSSLLGEEHAATLAFPFGDYGQHSDNKLLTPILLEEAQKYFQQTYAQFRKGEPYSSNYANTNSFLSRRIEVNPSLTGIQLVQFIAKGIAKGKEFQARMVPSDGWQSEWGHMSFGSAGLTIKPATNSTTAAVYLDGTRTLQHYTFSAKLTDFINSTTNVELAGLYNKKENYIGCIFYDQRIIAESVKGGNKTVLAEVTMLPGYRQTTELGVSVSKSSVTCMVNDNQVLSAAVDTTSQSGGPIIFVRDNAPEKAVVSLTAFSYGAASN